MLLHALALHKNQRVVMPRPVAHHQQFFGRVAAPVSHADGVPAEGKHHAAKLQQLVYRVPLRPVSSVLAVTILTNCPSVNLALYSCQSPVFLL